MLRKYVYEYISIIIAHPKMKVDARRRRRTKISVAEEIV